MLRRCICAARHFTTSPAALAVPAGTPSQPETHIRITEPSSAVPRNTFKSLTGRKTYLVDQYTHALRTNPILLVVHNSTLLKSEDKAFRRDLQKVGAKFTVVRTRLFNVAVRGLEHEDPASHDAAKKSRKTRHPLREMLKGSSAVITIPKLDPAVVDKVVSLVDKTNNRLILLGGQVDGAVLERQSIDEFRKMPTLEELHAQLAGTLTVLGGAGLVSTLETGSKVLYLTLDQHRQEQEKQ